jgi:RNA polymerase sigma-70 factor, ECF subfamily
MKMPNIISDQQVLAAIRAGNVDAFKIIVRQYEKRIAAIVFGMLGDCQEADDVGQETFIRFYKNIDKFKGQSQVLTYLTRIAINLSLNELKRRKRLLNRSLPLEKAEILCTGENDHLDADMKTVVQQAAQSLDIKFRSVVVLRLLQNYSTKETAEILKLPLGTVLSRLARAQAKLKVLLSPYMGD